MPRRKLSDEDLAEMINQHAAGSSLNDLAGEFDVTPQHAGRIVRAAKGCMAADAAREPLTLDEAEEWLARAVRKGSVGALKLWFDRHERQQPTADDLFAEFDPPGSR
jgi:hypothetical protein